MSKEKSHESNIFFQNTFVFCTGNYSVGAKISNVQTLTVPKSFENVADKELKKRLYRYIL